MTAPVFSRLVRVARVSRIKLVAHLCLTCCFSHLESGGPERMEGDSPARGTDPRWLGSAGGTVSCRGECHFGGRIARPCALLAPAESRQPQPCLEGVSCAMHRVCLGGRQEMLLMVPLMSAPTASAAPVKGMCRNNTVANVRMKLKSCQMLLSDPAKLNQP